MNTTMKPWNALRSLSETWSGLRSSRRIPTSAINDFGLCKPSVKLALTRFHALYASYFRVESTGVDNIPVRGPAILVANHSGVLPVDAAMLCFDVLHKLALQRIPRPIAASFASRLPIIGPALGRLGVVDGNRSNVRQLLSRGELLALWPEGVDGTGKLFTQRYQLQHWRHGFAALAMEYNAPVIPVAIVGAEESWPLIAKLKAHWFGAPYIPIPAWPFPLPVRYHIEYGTPIYFDQMPAMDCHQAALLVRIEVEQLMAKVRASRHGLFS
jgi:1-acyl-sn-glycerol-3-phosphate acyltransferase